MLVSFNHESGAKELGKDDKQSPNEPGRCHTVIHPVVEWKTCEDKEDAVPGMLPLYIIYIYPRFCRNVGDDSLFGDMEQY